MNRVVLDTNIWLSAIFWKGEANKLIELAEHGKIDIIISKDILSEIVVVLNKESKFQKFVIERKQAVEDVIRTILSFSKLVQVESNFNIIKDHPADNIILNAAVDGKARYIVSYDNHILSLKTFKYIKIVKPDEILKMF